VSDYETTQKRRNMTVGIFVLIGACALVWLIYRFGDLPASVSKFRSFQVFVQFPTAQGAQKDTPVHLSGYRIGRVTKIMAPERRRDLGTGQEYYQTLVVLSIDKKYVNIPADVEIKLMTRGLGSSYIELMVDPNSQTKEYLADGMLRQGSAGMTSEFFPAESQEKLDDLITGLKTLIKNANDIFGDKENKENIKTTLANLSKATKRATETIKEFRELAAAGTATLKNTDAGIEKVAVAMVDAGEQLSKTTAELRVILEKINNGKGSAGRLINDGRLYESLLENSKQLQVLLDELKLFITEVNEKGLGSKW